MSIGWASQCLGCNSKSLLYFTKKGEDWVLCTVCGWAGMRPSEVQIRRRHLVKTHADDIELGPAGVVPKDE
jgi:hypothetical protein